MQRKEKMKHEKRRLLRNSKTEELQKEKKAVEKKENK